MTLTPQNRFWYLGRRLLYLPARLPKIKVRARGQDGSTTEWAGLTIEVALLERSQWAAKLISGPRQSNDVPKRPFRLRKTITCPRAGHARLYASAHGLYQVEINGQVVGDQVLAPGWRVVQAPPALSDIRRFFYSEEKARTPLEFLLVKEWFAGRLGRPPVSNIWGDRLGFLGQLEIDGKPICVTDASWEYLDSPLITSEIYDGEVIDTTLEDGSWSRSHVLSYA